MNDQEYNRETLRRSIRQLPQHEAPADAWERLEAKLAEQNDQEKGRESLLAAIGQLPVYSAPTSIWEKIESSLHGKLPGAASGWKLALRTAAVLALLGALWVGWPSLSPNILPIAETESTIATPDQASLNEWESTKEADELRVFACLDSAQEVEGIASLIRQYEVINLSLDSLALLLSGEDVHEATGGRFLRLEQRRKQVLARIEQQACQDNSK